MRDFQRSMIAMFDQIDGVLEDDYHGRWQLMRNRSPRGETSNASADGLFDVGAFFSPGYGSQHGRGYLVKIALKTREEVASETQEEIESKVHTLMLELIPKYFPDRELEVVREGKMFKIIGDFNLGKV